MLAARTGLGVDLCLNRIMDINVALAATGNA